MSENLIVKKAMLFAMDAHAGQKRRYTNEDYISHPRHVVDILKQHEIFDEAVLSAAYLHDVVEDTAATFGVVKHHFGPVIAKLVFELTNRYTDIKIGNRAYRKNLERNRLSMISKNAQDIKIADMIDNLPSIIRYDPKFALSYQIECKNTLNVLTKGKPSLISELHAIILNYDGGAIDVNQTKTEEENAQIAIRISSNTNSCHADMQNGHKDNK